MYAAIHFPWDGGNLLLSSTVPNLEKKKASPFYAEFFGWIGTYVISTTNIN